MKSEIINVPNRGICILISDIDASQLSQLNIDIPTVNVLFTDVLVIANEIKEGRKIGAIKKVREQTKWGLKESKEYIDKYTIDYGNHVRNEEASLKFISDHTMDDFLEREEMQL
jgi:hypothetical protein